MSNQNFNFFYQFFVQPTYASPANTVVGNASGLQINLIWDTSVKASSNWKSIETSVVSAANALVSALNTSHHTVLNIGVGFGEVAGHALSAGSLGQSSTTNYLASYGTLTSALKGVNPSEAASFNTGLSGAQFAITSAQAKATGLLNPTSQSIDGYIGITSNTKVLSFSGTPTATQYDVTGIAVHELSEIMGRSSINGSQTYGGKALYTTLDLFRSGNTFSATLNGSTYTNTFNSNSSGDIGDWASSNDANDAFNAFGKPGVVNVLSGVDLVELSLLGYMPTSTMLASLSTGILV
jgi:hypothetical protein